MQFLDPIADVAIIVLVIFWLTQYDCPTWLKLTVLFVFSFIGVCVYTLVKVAAPLILSHHGL